MVEEVQYSQFMVVQEARRQKPNSSERKTSDEK